MFSNNIRIIYMYTVCFITLMMAIGGIIATVSSLANLYFPDVPIHYQMSEPEEFRLAEARIENQRIRSIRNIFNSSIVWIIAIPVFTLHWKQIPKDEITLDCND
ncbi:MAG: hypothetical protein FWG98_01415 [Candidatus Cloacimonetes bacterium]|nr:hypothetical protein [Candidatus Cloacimonadota bacterium]